MRKSKLPTTANVSDAREIANKAKAAGITTEEVQRIEVSYEYPIQKMRKFIQDFFKELERDNHYIYATLLHSSQKHFRIIRLFDWKLSRENEIKKNGLNGYIPPESYSLKLFNETLNTLHSFDEFDIFVFDMVFDGERVMTQEKVERLYQKFLREQCEAALRRDEQLQLTPEIISDYEFTDDDAAIVRKYLNRYNFEARNKIQKEFDALNKLSFVKK